ncbi:class III signal peptide-containing protein [Thermococcus sp.]
MREIRRNGQAAIEYLFMIALSLVIVLIVVRSLRQAANNTAKQISDSSEKITDELQKIVGNESASG